MRLKASANNPMSTRSELEGNARSNNARHAAPEHADMSDMYSGGEDEIDVVAGADSMGYSSMTERKPSTSNCNFDAGGSSSNSGDGLSQANSSSDFPNDAFNQQYSDYFASLNPEEQEQHLSASGNMNEADRKRAHHNALERKRRDHIKDSFHTLRDAIPNIQGEKVRNPNISTQQHLAFFVVVVNHIICLCVNECRHLELKFSRLPRTTSK